MGLKVMASIWLESDGIVYLKFMESGTTINAEEYRVQITNLASQLKAKKPCHYTVFLQDNVRPHKVKETLELLASKS